MKSLKDLKISYLTVHLSSGFSALKAIKKESSIGGVVGIPALGDILKGK